MDHPDSILRLKAILLKGQKKFIPVFCKTWVWPCLDYFLEFDMFHTLYSKSPPWEDALSNNSEIFCRVPM